MPANAMYAPESLYNALSGPQPVMGMDPNVNRLSLLPRYDARQGWVAPQFVYDFARALTAPGNALMGNTSPEEALNFGMNFMGAGLAGGAAAPVEGVVAGMGAMSAAEKAAATRLAKIERNKGYQHREAIRSEGMTQIEPTHSFGTAASVTPESLQGRVLVPIIGDNSRAGVRVNTLMGAPIEGGTLVQGGPAYSRVHADLASPAAWASNRQAATRVQNNLAGIADQTSQAPVGVFSAMEPSTGINFSVPVADLLVGAMQSMKVSKEAVRAFDAEVRRVSKVQGWPGIQSAEAARELLKRPGLGNLRKAVVETAAKAKYQNQGFPRIEDIQSAVIDPSLRDIRLGDAGATVFRTQPDKPVISGDRITVPHESYDTQIPGQYMGAFGDNVPFDVMFPDIAAQIRPRLSATEAKSGLWPILYRASRESGYYQPANQQWVDSVNAFLARGRE